MDREITPRDLAILGPFVVLLAIGSYAYIRHATAPSAPQGSRPSAVARPSERANEITPSKAVSADVSQAPIAQESANPAALPQRDYRFIAERNIFQPVQTKELPSPRPSRPTVSTRPSRPSASSSPRELGAPPPLPPAPPPLPAASPPTGLTPTGLASRPANLTTTSIVRLGDETFVLLENLQTRDTAWVRLGESAFGYQVVKAGDNYVEVRQGDVAYRITLGEGKQERKILAAGGAPAGVGPLRPGAPVPPGGFPPGPSPAGFGGQENRDRERGGRRSSGEWMTRVIERWNQLPDFVRNRILERIRENWNQLTPEQQKQIREAAQNFGVTLP